MRICSLHLQNSLLTKPYTRSPWAGSIILVLSTSYRHDRVVKIYLHFTCSEIRCSISILIQSHRSVHPNGPINNTTVLIQIMARRRTGGRPLSTAVMSSPLTHKYETMPQCVNKLWHIAKVKCIKVLPYVATNVKYSPVTTTAILLFREKIVLAVNG